MSVQTFRKKPVEIQAMQWTGDNLPDLIAWTKTLATIEGFYRQDPIEEGGKIYTASLWVEANSKWLGIETGEWVIRDSKGFYPCKADVFAASYEEV